MKSEDTNNIANTTGKIIKGIITSRVVVISLIVLLILLILAGSLYVIREDLFKKSSSASGAYVENSSMDATNGITTTYTDETTGEEVVYTDEKLVELFNEYGYDVGMHFSDQDGMKNLRYILDAEIVTQFPYIEGLSSDKTNGVVRFKRMSTEQESEESEGNIDGESASEEQYLKYTTLDQLNMWIAEYNADNNNSDSKANALNHFAMDENQNIIVAYIEEIKVSTNDSGITIQDIKTDIDIKYQNTDPTESNGLESGEKVYTFQLLKTESIAYADFIKEYTMPTELLLGLLAYSDDLQFVLDIAGLAHKSTIVIGIYDDVVSSDVKEYTYNKQTEINTQASIRLNYYINDMNDVLEDAFKDIWSTKQISKFKFPNDNQYLFSKNNIIEQIELDSNGEEKLYFINYYTYSNTPVIDLNVADVWYGYYNNIYNKIDTQNPKQINTIADEDYDEGVSVNISNTSNLDEQLEADIIKIYEEYLSGEEYKGIFKSKFDAEYSLEEIEYEFKNKLKEKFFEENREGYATQEDLEQGFLDYCDEWYEHDKEQEFDAFYQEKFQKALNDNIMMYKDNITITSPSVNKITKKRKFNCEETSYTTSASIYKTNSTAAENNYFSRILSNSAKAYSTLRSTGEWMIEQFENTEATVEIVDKVKHMLNNTYKTKQYGDISASDLGLFTTDSVDVNLRPSSNFTEIAKACHDYLRLNNYYYSSAANKEAGNYVKDGTSTGGKVQIELDAPQSERYTDCSAYVTWVLMQTGHIPSTNTSQRNSYWLYSNGTSIRGISEEIFSSRQDMIDFFDNEINISTEGYILVKQGHTEIFAGIEDGYYCTYNAGSTSSIRKEKSRYTEAQFFNHFNWSDYKVLIVE